ncbi:MAG: hypothetical protein H7258_01540, partial [Ferruginibacter sp.]|nr:hypothetical protein [Ferruginibacter sp.]
DRKITLVFGGQEITTADIETLKSQLKKYEIESASLDVKQGFAYLAEKHNRLEDTQPDQLTLALQSKEHEIKILQEKLDSISNGQNLNNQVYTELKAQYPELKSAILQPSILHTDSTGYRPTFLVVLSGNLKKAVKEKAKIENWLKVRLHQNDIQLILKN